MSDHQTTTLTERLRAFDHGDPLTTAAADEIDRLRDALRQVRQAIFRTASDTVWMQTPCPETACDFIAATLGEGA